LFGISAGGGDAFKGFVENGDDALLFGERREWDLKRFNEWQLYTLNRCTSS
jgi:hypothetical protein